MKAAPPRSKARSDERRPAPAKKASPARAKAKVASPKPSRVEKPQPAAKGAKAASKQAKLAVATPSEAAKAPVAARAVVAKAPAGKAAPAAPIKALADKVAPAAPTKARPAKAAAASAQAAPGKPAPAKAVGAAATKAAAAKAAKAAAAKTAADAKPTPSPPAKPARKSVKEAAGVSTEAVARRTGKSWDGWFEVLDSAGAANLDQRGVIAILAQKHGIGPWWQQMIAVGYEAVRGKNEKPPVVEGFDISSSRTLDAPTSRVFRLWNDSSERARWLADDRFMIRTASAGKSIQARWGKGGSHVAVSFLERAGRTEVSVQHHQIESRSAADQMKSYWAKKLGLLEQVLSPSPKA